MIGVGTTVETEVVMRLVGAAIQGDKSMPGMETSTLTLVRVVAVEVCAMQVRTRELGEVVRDHTARFLGGGCVNRFAYAAMHGAGHLR